jgi:hypothetical protein
MSENYADLQIIALLRIECAKMRALRPRISNKDYDHGTQTQKEGVLSGEDGTRDGARTSRQSQGFAVGRAEDD